MDKTALLQAWIAGRLVGSVAPLLVLPKRWFVCSFSLSFMVVFRLLALHPTHLFTKSVYIYNKNNKS
jgi:hypothetical protein